MTFLQVLQLFCLKLLLRIFVEQTALETRDSVSLWGKERICVWPGQQRPFLPAGQRWSSFAGNHFSRLRFWKLSFKAGTSTRLLCEHHPLGLAFATPPRDLGSKGSWCKQEIHTAFWARNIKCLDPLGSLWEKKVFQEGGNGQLGQMPSTCKCGLRSDHLICQCGDCVTK